MQKLADGPLTNSVAGKEVWLDGGHNPHAARAVAALVGDMPGETHLVCAMMAGKDARGFFAAFAALGCAVHTCPNAGGRNGADPEALAEAARTAGLKADAHTTFEAALRACARTSAARILICGSLYLAGDVLVRNDQLPV
jgi:dihydrofolate synthase/folylpolyglutamate synthase